MVNPYVPSVLLSEMQHMVVLSLLNNIKVYVVTHVKVKYRPMLLLLGTLHLNFIDFVKPIYIII
jgi:hypothetical protein